MGGGLTASRNEYGASPVASNGVFLRGRPSPAVTTGNLAKNTGVWIEFKPYERVFETAIALGRFKPLKEDESVDTTRAEAVAFETNRTQAKEAGGSLNPR